MFVAEFAAAMTSADARRPQASSARSDRVYRPGIGPHAEDQAVELTVTELKRFHPDRYRKLRTRVPYPSSRQKCDLALGDAPDWAIEVKMARFSGDNGKPDDTAVKDLLSPYSCDRSAVFDCEKLASAGFPGRTAVLIYGFEDNRRPLGGAIEAFEVLAGTRVILGPRRTARLEGLVHPVFSVGRVFAWEVSPR